MQKYILFRTYFKQIFQKGELYNIHFAQFCTYKHAPYSSVSQVKKFRKLIILRIHAIHAAKYQWNTQHIKDLNDTFLRIVPYSLPTDFPSMDPWSKKYHSDGWYTMYWYKTKRERCMFWASCTAGTLRQLNVILLFFVSIHHGMTYFWTPDNFHVSVGFTLKFETIRSLEVDEQNSC